MLRNFILVRWNAIQLETIKAYTAGKPESILNRMLFPYDPKQKLNGWLQSLSLVELPLPSDHRKSLLEVKQLKTRPW